MGAKEKLWPSRPTFTRQLESKKNKEVPIRTMNEAMKLFRDVDDKIHKLKVMKMANSTSLPKLEVQKKSLIISNSAQKIEKKVEKPETIKPKQSSMKKLASMTGGF